MAMKRSALQVVCMVFALAILLPACAEPVSTPAERPQNVSLTILGLAAGTAVQLRADAVAEALRVEYPDWKVTSLAPGGEPQTISKRIAGEGEFHFTSHPRPLEIEAQAPQYSDIDYAKATAYSLVLPTATTYVHFFALGKTGITSIKDIVDKKYPFKVGTGPGASKLLFYKILEHYGASMTEAEGWGAKHEIVIVATPQGAEALETGRIDIGLTWSAIPSPAYMGATFDLKLLPIDDPGLIEMFKKYGYNEATLPAGTYPFVKKDVPTMSTISYLAVRPDVPEDVVYYTVKALFNRKDILIAAHAGFESQMTPEAIAASVALSQGTGVSFHPGALKFYQESGWIK